MNGAHALIHTLVNSGIDHCFANPGTSEMHLLAAMDDVPGLQAVLTLFEGVATGAADGFARMAGRPAVTLLHLGPGLANGLANLHNARRARVPVVNVVGDHATYHKHLDAPLESDIDAAAGVVSGWFGRPLTPEALGPLAAEAVAAAQGPPSRVATLVIPADVSWSEGALPGGPVEPSPRCTQPIGDRLDEVARALRSGQRCVLLLGGRATMADSLAHADQVRSASGADLLVETFPARHQRGMGRPVVHRLLYDIDAAARQLAGVEHLILVDAASPIAFFAYPGRSSSLVPAGCTTHLLDVDALPLLAKLIDTDSTAPRTERTLDPPPDGPLTPAAIGHSVASLLPEDAVVVDEAATSGGPIFAATASAAPHDWLRLTGGAIGSGLPMAIGAALGAPGQKVVALEADGSAMYTIQALWTMVRQSLDITTVILNNRAYAVLRTELERVAAVPGPTALDMMELSRPDLNFSTIGAGHGMPSERVTTASQFHTAFTRALAAPGPSLIEAML
jgi:acetolactate synthase-1/2/3 large subunit